jgi:hypothetical protein
MDERKARIQALKWLIHLIEEHDLSENPFVNEDESMVKDEISRIKDELQADLDYEEDDDETDYGNPADGYIQDFDWDWRG